jgi:hypothetical protein
MYAHLASNIKKSLSTLEPYQKNSYRVICDNLINLHGLDSRQYWKEFKARVPKLNEMFKSFCTDIKILLNKASNIFSEIFKDFLLLDKLLRYLPEQIKQKIDLSEERLTFNFICCKVSKVFDSFGQLENVQLPYLSIPTKVNKVNKKFVNPLVPFVAILIT